MTGPLLAGLAFICLVLGAYMPGLKEQTRMHLGIGATVFGLAAVTSAVAYAK